MLPIIGYSETWSQDKNVLVQVFQNLETDSIERITINVRAQKLSSWESLQEVSFPN